MKKAKAQEVAEHVPEDSVEKAVALPVEEDGADQVVDENQDGRVEGGQGGQDDRGETDGDAAQDHPDDQDYGAEDSLEQVVDNPLDESGESFGQESSVWSVLESLEILSNVVPERVEPKW